MTIRYSEEFAHDLDDIEHNAPEVWPVVARGLATALEGLRSGRVVGHRRPDLDAELLFYRVSGYLLLFDPTPEGFTVLRFLHERRHPREFRRA